MVALGFSSLYSTRSTIITITLAASISVVVTSVGCLEEIQKGIEKVGGCSISVVIESSLGKDPVTNVFGCSVPTDPFHWHSLSHRDQDKEESTHEQECLHD